MMLARYLSSGMRIPCDHIAVTGRRGFVDQESAHEQRTKVSAAAGRETGSHAKQRVSGIAREAVLGEIVSRIRLKFGRRGSLCN